MANTKDKEKVRTREVLDMRAYCINWQGRSHLSASNVTTWDELEQTDSLPSWDEVAALLTQFGRNVIRFSG